MTEPLNQILYGPPGTGKTYFTVNKALKILDPDFLEQNGSDRTALKQRYEYFRSRGRIVTVTFHQSFSYEDFVEGLRASSDENGQIQYKIESGIFKGLCDSARTTTTVQSTERITLADRRIWKMSLGNTLDPNENIYDECIRNGYILLGWGGDLDYTAAAAQADIERIHEQGGVASEENSYAVTAVNLFINIIGIGDLVVVSDGNHKFRAIGEVTGEYRYLSSRDSGTYCQARNVRWLCTYSPSLPHEQLMKKAFSQRALYELTANSIDMDKLADLLNSDYLASSRSESSPFQPGKVFGQGYTVREVTPDVLRLTKPNGSKLGFDLEMLNELAALVKAGTIGIQDIREKTVFENTDVNLEKYIVNGYSNILPELIEHTLTENAEIFRSIESEKDYYVLIIDEINRGNIANIFGELITLIEPSKRDGAPEAAEVILPYSKETFSVPDNLYIVGTMNTADRSLVHLDTALRRRFDFEEMMPDSQVLVKKGIEEVEGVDIVTMLKVMNQRVELLYDRDHMLGHSFFLPLAETPTITCLADIFERQILPLLEEYFFEDWSKIRQILGDDQKKKKIHAL